MKRYTFIVCVLLVMVSQSLSERRQATRASEIQLGTVELRAYNQKGVLLSSKDIGVLSFRNRNDEDFSKRFHEGIAAELPFGYYTMDAEVLGGGVYIRPVRVFQKRVTVVIGAMFSDIPNYYGPPLHGRVIGFPPDKKGFVKLTGVFSSWSQESAIASDGGFDFDTWLLDGPFVLMVVTENGMIASRQVTLPYTGPPLQIEIVKDRGIPKPD